MALSGCEQRRDFLRFRLTLRFSGPDGTFEGSSVRETWFTEDPTWFPSDNTPNPRWRGEATVVRLGGRRVICGMLDGYSTVTGHLERSYGPWSPLEVLLQRRWAPLPGDFEDGRPRFRGARPTTPELIEELKKGELVLQPAELPVLVALKDSSIPRSGRLVAPSQISEVFPGLALGRCTVGVTRDHVRFGVVNEVMPWIARGPDWVTVRDGDLSSNVVTEDFSRK
ncbi:hypothetical protein [Brevundimonas sp.]|uniref:hypothetical protein n=1 Tax=Brevundimonas sp. TaxID=1871086 RepID=UPI0035643777